MRAWRWSVVQSCLLAAVLAGCSSNSGTSAPLADGSTARGDLGPGSDGAALVDASTAPSDGWTPPTFDVPSRDAPDAAGDAPADGADALTVTTLADGAMTACGPRERCGNGIDDDCNGMTDEECSCIPGTTQRCYPGDALRAGAGVCTWGTQRCGGREEFGTWEPCMGFGQPRAVDCRMPTVDNRCDGMAGVGCLCTLGASRSCYSGPMGTQGRGLCRAGAQTCVVTPTGSGWGPCAGEVLPVRDACDGRDSDCDGFPNTGCGCMRGATRTCYSGAAGTAGRGLCRNGTQTCVSTTSGGGTVWGPCAGEVVPAADVCNGVDRNCDGNPNTNCTCTLDAVEVCYTGPAGTANVGRCRPGSRRCNALVRPDGTLTSTWGTCLAQTLPGAAEICANMIDDNCNRMVDEACTPDCAVGTIRCAGRCIDVRSDPLNCGACGNVCPSGQACANGVCVGSGMLRITMVWSLAGDVDLHVVPPCGQEISFLATNRCGGQLDRDDTSGTGPENVFWAAAPMSGTYLVCAVPYRVSGATNVTVTVNQGARVLNTWMVPRAVSSGNAACTRESPHFVGAFNY
jgi:hypothetical protein